MGRKALVGAVYLAPVDLARPLVPRDLSIVSVLPGRTLATVFLADYGPGSTLEYHEFGIQPALVRFRGTRAVWNRLLLVDSLDSVRGGDQLGFHKQFANFDWHEDAARSGRVSGECAIRLEGSEVVRVRYRQGRIPFPSLPVQAITMREDMVLTCLNRLSGRFRLSSVAFEASPGGPAEILNHLGEPVLGVVATGYSGVMADDARALGFPPRRDPIREK